MKGDPRLLVLQMYHGDRGLGLSLARLIADLEPSFQEDCHFMFAWRKGCARDADTVAYVGKKFRVHEYYGINHVEGWPLGPNTLWLEVVGSICQQVRRGVARWDSVFTFEPDCTPVKKTWWREIFAEFDEARKTPTRHGRQCFWMGHYTCPPEFTEHLNGNLVFDPAFYRVTPEIATTPVAHAWDVYWAPTMIPYSKPSRLIYNDYRRRPSGGTEVWEFTEDDLFGPRYRPINNPLAGEELRPVFIHGTKQSASHDLARARLLGGVP